MLFILRIYTLNRVVMLLVGSHLLITPLSKSSLTSFYIYDIYQSHSQIKGLRRFRLEAYKERKTSVTMVYAR